MKKGSGKIGLFLLGGVFSSILVVFVYSMLQVQIVHGEDYILKRERRSESARNLGAVRGEILLSDGTPIVRNVRVNNIIFDGAKMPKEEYNTIILRLTQLLTQNGERWLDHLPVTFEEPFVFLENHEKEIEALKKTLKLQSWATEEHVMKKLIEDYDISPEKYTPAEIRAIAGVRYEMERTDFSDKIPYTFAENISPATSIQIHEGGAFDYPGVETAEASVREYTDGTLIPHLLGTVGPFYKEDLTDPRYNGPEDDYDFYTDQVGRSGLEEAMESELRGTKGQVVIKKNQETGEILEETVTDPVPGHSVQITIDPQLQRVAQQSLEKQIKYLQATAPVGKGKEAHAGAVAVIHVPTGEILALAQYPSYDINEYRTRYSELASAQDNPLWDRALKGQYAPGSCYKPAVAVGAITEGLVDRNYTVFCDHIYRFYSDFQPKCLGRHLDTTVLKALQKSCNIYFYDTGRRMGIDKINQYSSQLGLGQPTGIEIDSFQGILASPSYAQEMRGVKWEAGDVLQASIGQSYNQFSPLQLANYTSTIARNGVRQETHLIKRIVSYDGGKVLQEKGPTVVEQMAQVNDNFALVKEGMLMATQPGGTSSAYWGGFSLPVASKTGTPQTSDEKQNSVYIAFSPVENSEIAVCVIIEDGWHGYTGAPVARDLFNAYFFDDFDINN